MKIWPLSLLDSPKPKWCPSRMPLTGYTCDRPHHHPGKHRAANFWNGTPGPEWSGV